MLILPEWLLTAGNAEPRRGFGIRIEGATVADVNSHSGLRDQYPDDEVHEAPGRVLLPGFVNAHTHLYGALAHGIPTSAAPSDFWSFLEDFWWPYVEDAVTQDMIAAATAWASVEMVRTGTTSFYDILEAPSALPDALLVEREVVERHGLRGILSFEATERVSKENGRLGLAENSRLIDATNQADGLVSGAMCFHTTFTCSEALIREAFELAEHHGVFCHAHCNEGVHEPEWCLDKFGKRTLEYYDDLGVAGERFLASQCVQLSETEMRIIVERGVRCAHMPLANCEVGGGIAPVTDLLRSGTTVGLGTDGYINDMFEVMRGASHLQKARTMNPGALPGSDVLTLATEGGARVLGLERVGRLEPGWSADLQLVDAEFPTPATSENLTSQLVLWRSGHHVRDVMVAGTWRVLDGEILGVDVEATRRDLHEQARKLWAT